MMAIACLPWYIWLTKMPGLQTVRFLSTVQSISEYTPHLHCTEEFNDIDCMKATCA